MHHLPLLLPTFLWYRTEKRGQVATAQALSGTGALHLASLMLCQTLGPQTPVYITNPTWSNHRQVFESIGFEVRELNYYSADSGQLDMAGFLDALRETPRDAIIVFHACTHNPSGCDPTREEWKEIAPVVQERHIFPLFDAAY
jgi:aspartate aminotransferase